MNLIKSLNSTIGQKIIMALTGLALVGFVLAHLTGNLLIYVGPEAINAYAAGLKKMPTLAVVWVMRTGLLVFFLGHVIKGIMLTLRARKVSPKYKKPTVNKATVASRSMIWSGLALLLFVLYHLAHFTFLWTHPEYANLVDGTGRHDVYAMIVNSFQNPLIALFYIGSMVFLWLHLCHGASSVFRTLGVSHPGWTLCTDRIGPAVATVLLVGNSSIPLSVYFGLIG